MLLLLTSPQLPSSSSGGWLPRGSAAYTVLLHWALRTPVPREEALERRWSQQMWERQEDWGDDGTAGLPAYFLKEVIAFGI